MQKNGNEVVNVEEDIWDYLESQCLKIPQKVSFFFQIFMLEIRQFEERYLVPN